MAFIFVPNADGGFNEGDRQMNDETGVEYIYVDGAWRPLGPKIDTQFDVLDERYVNIDGDTIHGALKFDHGDDSDANLLIRPNISNDSTSIYQLNGGALRLRTLPGENTNDGSTTHIAIGKNEADGEPETYIYHLQDPGGPLHGVNLQYLETYVSDYLPLTGGDMTGDLTINNAGLIVDKSSGTAVTIKKDGITNLQFWVDGSATTTKTTFSDDNLVTKLYVDTKVAGINSDYLPLTGGTLTGNLRMEGAGFYTNAIIKSTRNSGNAFQVKPDDGDETAFIKTDGKAKFSKLTVDSDDFGKIDLRGDANCDIRRNGTYMISLHQDKIGFSQHLDVNNKRIKNLAAPDLSSDAATKSYVDTKVSEIGRNYPGLRFKFSSGTGASLGKFNYYDSGGLKLRVSNNSQDFKWNDGGLTVDYSFSEGHRWSIYEKLSDGSLKIIRTGTYNRADYHSSDVLFHVSSHQTNGSLNTSSEYYLSISGFF